MSYNILFINDNFCKRGTENALFDYAHYNETLLLGISWIASPRKCQIEDQESIQRFQKRFKEIKWFSSKEELHQIIRDTGVDLIYLIKSGARDTGIDPEWLQWDQKEISSKQVTNGQEPPSVFIHCVFDCSQPHGDYYIPISESIAQRWDIPKWYNLPHIVSMEPMGNDINDLRQSLNIPDDALVFGRYGGKETFDIHFVHKVIYDLSLDPQSNIYFLFMNTDVFVPIPNRKIFFLPGTTDPNLKRVFIEACDAMIHARHMGESFGLACAEFNICEKPVITYRYSRDKEHIDILKGKYMEEVLELKVPEGQSSELKVQVLKTPGPKVPGPKVPGPKVPKKQSPVKNNSLLPDIECLLYSNETDLKDIFLNFKKGTKARNMYLKFSPENVMSQFDVMLQNPFPSQQPLILSYGKYDPVSLFKMRNFYCWPTGPGTSTQREGTRSKLEIIKEPDVPDIILDLIPLPQNLLNHGYHECRMLWYNWINKLRSVALRLKKESDISDEKQDDSVPSSPHQERLIVYCFGDLVMLDPDFAKLQTHELIVSPIIYMSSDYKGTKDSFDYHVGICYQSDFIRMFDITDEDLGFIFRRSSDIQNIFGHLAKRATLNVKISSGYQKLIYNGKDY